MHHLTLTPAQRDDLVALRDTGAKPYLRERAAALLKLADGQVAAQVARAGLLRPRQPDTLYRWLARYRAEGIAGLHDRPGRGRKPAFSPSAPGCAGGPGGAAGPRPPRAAAARGGADPVDPGRRGAGLSLAGRV